jgi:hypothetical protein
MCGCVGDVCNTASLSENFLSEYEILFGDLYAQSEYQFQARAVLTKKVPTAERAYLVQIGAALAGPWSSWSPSITTPVGLPPSQPPHPELLTAKITSLKFRIWRTQWNGIPVKHYVFELAEDTQCAVLNNLIWNKVPPVIVPVNSTFAPYVDFLRGDPFKGGIG